ncbi:hypothetical protein KBC79_06605 [Candidatus Woesebacteria bacterium]|nr:hypothetical protein [Candidatus Woesebacteria bacterium]
MPNVHVTPIVGLPQFAGWSHVIEGTHSSPHRFIAALAISGKQASNAGRDVASILLAETINSAEELHTKLNSALQHCQRVECQFSVAAALISHQQVIFAVYCGAVFLKRGNKAGTILSSGESLKLVEGNHQLSDVCVLVTEQATQFLGEVELKFKQGYDIDTIITSIVPGVHSQENSSLSSFAFIHEYEAEMEATGHGIAFPESRGDETQEADPEVQPESEQTESLSDTNESGAADLSPKNTKEETPPPTKTYIFRLTQLLRGTLSVLASFAQWLWLLIQWLIQGAKVLTKKLIGLLRKPDAAGTGNSYESVTQSRKRKMILGLIVLIALVVVVVGVYLLGQRSNEVKRAQELIVPLAAQVQGAQAQVEAEPLQARDSVESVIRELEALKATYQEKPHMVALFDEQLQTSRQVATLISGRDTLDQLPVFYDLRLVISNFVTSHTGIAGRKALFLDAEQRQLIALDLDQKKPEVFSVESLSNLQSMASIENRALFLSDGIHALELEPERQLDLVKDPGESNNEGKLLGVFDRYVYVFNPVKRNIYRYARQDDGYSDPIGWLQVTQGLDFTTVVSMGIDGDIWLGSSDGSLRKFTSGEEQELEIAGLPEPFDSAIQVVTDAESQYVYVLEPARHRLVTLAKTGEFIREINNQSLGAVTGLVVNEKSGAAYAVSGATVFEVRL